MNRTTLKQALHRLPALYRLATSVGKAWDIRRGAWTEPELLVARAALRAGDTAVDVGANYGMWSYHLACWVGTQGRVVAFEPIPATADALRRVVWMLGVSSRVEVVPAGCGERDETVQFSLPIADASGMPIAGLARISTHESGVEFAVAEAEIVRLDDAKIPGRVAVLKIDTEGAELFGLRGAHELLRRDQPTVVCEIGRGLPRERFGVDVNDLTTLMSGLGYALYRFDGRRLHAEDLSGSHDGNYVFVAERGRERLRHLLNDIACDHTGFA